MKFGTIGAGAVALAFAREALAAGHEVVLGSLGGPEWIVAYLHPQQAIVTSYPQHLPRPSLWPSVPS